MDYTKDDQAWLMLFDETNDKFKWFFIKYFSLVVWTKLISYRKQNNVVGMVTIMNDIWFCLPDNKFNIIENPPGWSEFLNLIEL